MHGEWQHFTPTLLVEVEESLLKRWGALYALASVWRRGEREKYMRVLARLDVHVNSPPKSGPKPCKSMASFCHLFLL
jgi:hypothetical protein